MIPALKVSYQTLDPSTEELIQTYPEIHWEEVKQKCEKAKNAFALWRETAPTKRSHFFANLAKSLRAKSEVLSDLITTEMGKITKEAKNEIEKCALACEYFAKHHPNFLKERKVATEAKKSFVSFEPIGTILGIMPWNFPFWQVFRFAIPTMMLGNVLLLKHAQNVPASALATEKLFEESGFPKDIFQNLFINHDMISKLIASPYIQGVSLTGSISAGRHIANVAGQNLKKVVLELGGSDPFIVCEDADLGKAIPAALGSRLINCGQSCVAAKRFIVTKKVYPQFLEGLREALSRLKVGHPKNPETEIGPLAREDLLKSLSHQVELSQKQGAKILLGGKKTHGKGYFYLPTLLTEVGPGQSAFDEEIFGPVFCVKEAQNETEAILIANTSRFGLGASLWTKDLERAEKLASQMEAGIVFVNEIVKSDVRLPFGGIKESGFGRELGEFCFFEFANIKSVWIS